MVKNKAFPLHQDMAMIPTNNMIIQHNTVSPTQYSWVLKMEERKIKTVFSHDEVTRTTFILPLWTTTNLIKYTKKSFRHLTTGSVKLCSLRREINEKSFMILPAYCLKASFQSTAQKSREHSGLTELKRQKQEVRRAKATRIGR